MVDAGFVQLQLERIVATCAIDHGASAHVLEKVGLPNRVITDTGGEFIFFAAIKLTTAVFKHLPKITRAYC
jgi:RimJ/RimL family protein N-acetyltransferase